MKLQIIESISKHEVTLVLAIGILMLIDKGIMPIGMIALLLLTEGIIGFLFRALLLIVRIAFIFFHCRTPVFLTNKTNRYENKYMCIFRSCHAGCMATGRTYQTGQKDVCPIQLMSLKTSATIWNLCVILQAIRTGRIS